MPTQSVYRAPAQTATASQSAPRPRFERVTCFALYADAHDPGLLGRILEPIAKLGLVPEGVHVTRWGGGAELHVDVQIAGLEPMRATHIAEVMRGLVGVTCVLMSDKHRV